MWFYGFLFVFYSVRLLFVSHAHHFVRIFIVKSAENFRQLIFNFIYKNYQHSQQVNHQTIEVIFEICQKYHVFLWF